MHPDQFVASRGSQVTGCRSENFELLLQLIFRLPSSLRATSAVVRKVAVGIRGVLFDEL